MKGALPLLVCQILLILIVKKITCRADDQRPQYNVEENRASEIYGPSNDAQYKVHNSYSDSDSESSWTEEDRADKETSKNNNSPGRTLNIFDSSPNPDNDDDECVCKGDKQQNSFCFYKDPGNNLITIRYKGSANFKLQNIIKNYVLYYNNVVESGSQINLETILNHDDRFNIDLSLFVQQINEINKHNKQFNILIENNELNINKSVSEEGNEDSTSESDEVNYDQKNTKVANEIIDYQTSDDNTKNSKNIISYQELNAQDQLIEKLLTVIKTQSVISKFTAETQAQIMANAKAIALAEIRIRAQIEALIKVLFKAHLDINTLNQVHAITQILNHLKAQAKVLAQARVRVLAQIHAIMNAHGTNKHNKISDISDAFDLSFIEDNNGQLDLNGLFCQEHGLHKVSDRVADSADDLEEDDGDNVTGEAKSAWDNYKEKLFDDNVSTLTTPKQR